MATTETRPVQMMKWSIMQSEIGHFWHRLHASTATAAERIKDHVNLHEQIGVEDVTGVELVDSPPLVSRTDPHNLPFFDGVFDLGFSAHLDQALFPSRFASEMERTVRAGGVCVVAVEECGDAEVEECGDAEVEEMANLFRKSRVTEMAMNCIKSARSVIMTKEVVGLEGWRMFSAKAKKGSKGGGASDAQKVSILSKEEKASKVVGGNIIKDGADPKILPDSEYPDWLWHLLDKRPALSELKRKKTETLPYEDLKRLVKLDNRARIKENNSVKAKN